MGGGEGSCQWALSKCRTRWEIGRAEVRSSTRGSGSTETCLHPLPRAAPWCQAQGDALLGGPWGRAGTMCSRAQRCSPGVGQPAGSSGGIPSDVAEGQRTGLAGEGGQDPRGDRQLKQPLGARLAGVWPHCSPVPGLPGRAGATLLCLCAPSRSPAPQRRGCG